MSSPSFNAALLEIQKDTSSGAAEIAQKGLNAILREGIVSVSIPKHELLQHLRSCAKLLIDTHPEMAVLESLLREFLGTISTRLLKDDESRGHAEVIQTIGTSLTQELLRREEQTAANLANCLKKYSSFLTLSWSSTVYNAFVILKQSSRTRVKRILVAESRPLFEGRTLATRLAQLDFNVELIIDAAIGRYVNNVEVAICGADTIFVDGSILNKVGSYLLALSCANCNPSIPFMVGSSSTKFCDRSYNENLAAIITKRPPEEILFNWRELKVKPRNEYFEIIPRRLISALITDEGVITSDFGKKIKNILSMRFSSHLQTID